MFFFIGFVPLTFVHLEKKSSLVLRNTSHPKWIDLSYNRQKKMKYQTSKPYVLEK